MSSKSLPIISSSHTNRSKSTLPKIEESKTGWQAFYPQPMTKDDVIRTFFNQIVEIAIEDMIITEPKEEKESRHDSEFVSVKDYKDLEAEDLKNSQVLSIKGSKVSLKKSTSRLSAKKKKSTSSNRSIFTMNERSIGKKGSTTSSSFTNYSFLDEERSVRIIFTTGNTYEGSISRRIMNGRGIYKWSDGTVYEGEFFDGFPTGQGQMTLPDLSHYVGSFNQGLFNGEGFLNIVSTPTFYSGQWEAGKKHGKGWLLYEPGDWYEGEWKNDKKHGFGLRHYKNGAKYRGTWKNGLYDGTGTMIWENHDYYKGEWVRGLMHGQGKYIWRAFFNKTFTFPIQNVYKGSWSHGKRCGKGVMHFGGESGARLKGTWHQDFKDGDGFLICGNGILAQSPNLFQCDKPPPALACSSYSEGYVYMEVPMFAIPEDVDVGFYIDKILLNLKNVDEEKLKILKIFEAKCVRNTIINFLPQLNELYRDYAMICAKEPISHRPLLVRMFLWQLYRDIDVFKHGLSLADTDRILAENPKSALDTLHYPFEPIYFWQFMMSLIGVALTTCNLSGDFEGPPTGGVCASVVKRFFVGIIFGQLAGHKNSLVVSCIDLVPVKSVYRLYMKLGEPHTARTFLRHCCTRKGEIPVLCHLDILRERSEPKFGRNTVPLAEYVTFMEEDNTEEVLNEKTRRNWTSLMDFRHLGLRNLLRCLTEVCPSIMEDDVVINIDYPLTFLEFYEVLLTCIFMVLDLEMKKEKKLQQDQEIVIQQSMSSSIGSRKKSMKVEKKNSKNKKK